MHDLTTHATAVCQSTQEWQTTINSYTVRYGYTPQGLYQYDWSCTCKGFQFRGRCKHIEQAKASGERCGWNGEQEVGMSAAKDAEGNPCCPVCGGPVTPVNVGV